MQLRAWTAALCVVVCSLVSAADHKLEITKAAPEGFAPDIAKLLSPQGYQINGAKGAVVEVWFANDIAVKDGFKPSLSQMYPFQSGQLIGAIRVAKGADFTDFRNQQVKPGVYTLRFGLQPSDGNHVGTSETSDFLLALPAAIDSKPESISSPAALAKSSAKASGATHPAIFSLVDPKKAANEAKLEKEGDDHWILNAVLNGKAKDQAVPVKLRLIVIGHSEG